MVRHRRLSLYVGPDPVPDPRAGAGRRPHRARRSMPVRCLLVGELQAAWRFSPVNWAPEPMPEGHTMFVKPGAYGYVPYDTTDPSIIREAMATAQRGHLIAGGMREIAPRRSSRRLCRNPLTPRWRAWRSAPRRISAACGTGRTNRPASAGVSTPLPHPDRRPTDDHTVSRSICDGCETGHTRRAAVEERSRLGILCGRYHARCWKTWATATQWLRPD